MKKVDFEYETEEHEQFFYEQMNERGKRLYLSLEAMKSGYNGVAQVLKSIRHINILFDAAKRNCWNRKFHLRKKFVKKVGVEKKTLLHK